MDAFGPMRPRLLAGDCLHWPASRWSWRKWRHVLRGWKAPVQTRSGVGAPLDYDAFLRVLEGPSRVAANEGWFVKDRLVGEPLVPGAFGRLPTEDFLEELNVAHDAKVHYLLAGACGTSTPMHTGALGMHEWVGLFTGRKRWSFWAPSNSAPTCPPALSFVQLPGDLVYIPSAVWRAVDDVGPTIAYSRSTVDDRNCAVAILECVRAGNLELARHLAQLATRRLVARWESGEHASVRA
jgi:hypothetical protein